MQLVWVLSMVAVAGVAAGGGLPNMTYPVAGGGGAAEVTHAFFNESVGGVWYSGHVVTLANASPETFSFAVPFPGGCGTKAYATTTAAAHGCVAATNAGFFDVATGACIGSVVAGGKAVQATNVTLASFGMVAGADGSDAAFFVGYVGPQSVAGLADAGFVELVSGVGWLVARGVSFLNQSLAYEHPSPAFVAEPAPRLVIGHTAAGALVIIEVDGDELFKRGPNLVQLTDIALHFGLYNAVNLDGGASDTVVLGNSLCSSCGALNQTCANVDPAPARWVNDTGRYSPCIECGYAAPHNGGGVAIPLCQRAVTTIACFHDPPSRG